MGIELRIEVEKPFEKELQVICEIERDGVKSDNDFASEYLSFSP